MITTNKPAIESLVENVISTRFEDLDRNTVDNTKDRILDIIGDTIGGANEPASLALVKIFKRWGGRKEATILGHGIKAPAAQAAMANCILCRSFDREPLVVIVGPQRLPSHTTGTTAPTAITMAEKQGVSGKELITSLVVGDDLAARIFAGTEHAWNRTENRPGTVQQSAGFEPWGTITAFGAAAITGRLLGLNPKQMKNALGIVLNLISGAGNGLNDGATTFKLSQGDSGRNGVLAAELAQAGWIGVEDAIMGRGGYYATFSHGCDHPEVLTQDLGRKYFVEVIIKPFPGGRPTHIPITAALALMSKNKIKTDDIEEVILHLSVPAKYGHYMRPYKVGDYPTGDALFSYRFSTASALYRKSATNANYSEEQIRDPKLQALIVKVKFADSAKPSGVELEVRMKDGRVITEYTPVAIGELPNPLTGDALKAKFMEQVEFSQTVSEKNAKKIIRLVENLEEVENIREIVDLAVKPK